MKGGRNVCWKETRQTFFFFGARFLGAAFSLGSAAFLAGTLGLGSSSSALLAFATSAFCGQARD
jgi:hypothetical protein